MAIGSRDVTNYPSFGLGFVDELLAGGLRPGDNILLLAQRGTPSLALIKAFVEAPAPETVIVDLGGAWSGHGSSNRTVLNWGGLLGSGAHVSGEPSRVGADADVDALTEQIAEVEGATGEGTYWLFDSLTALQRARGADQTLAVFMIVCPRLIRQNSVALLPVDPEEHDGAFLDRVRSTVQVVLELQRTPAGAELAVTKADGRPAEAIGRRAEFRVRDGEFDVGPITTGIQDIGRQLRSERLRQGMSQAELGGLVGVSASAISQFERGTSGLSGHVLTRIWHALDVPFGPDDEHQRGFRIVRRGEIAQTDLWEGVRARLLFDHRDVGSGWHVTIAPESSRRQGMFPVKATEIILIRAGLFDVEIAGEWTTLSEGDTLVTTKELITAWRNPAQHPAELLWFTLDRRPNG